MISLKKAFIKNHIDRGWFNGIIAGMLAAKIADEWFWLLIYPLIFLVMTMLFQSEEPELEPLESKSKRKSK
jgi:hypothetical protein